MHLLVHRLFLVKSLNLVPQGNPLLLQSPTQVTLRVLSISVVPTSRRLPLCAVPLLS